MEKLNRQQILERRKEIEQELLELLAAAESEFGLDDVKEAIFNEEETDDMMKVVAMFDNGQGAGDLSNILETVSDAWNYFPHKILNGISPAEKASER